jgi:hypothetical protein
LDAEEDVEAVEAVEAVVDAEERVELPVDVAARTRRRNGYP